MRRVTSGFEGVLALAMECSRASFPPVRPSEVLWWSPAGTEAPLVSTELTSCGPEALHRALPDQASLGGGFY